MELIKDYKVLEPGEIETAVYQLYSYDGCEILYQANNSRYDVCNDFWSGVISKGLQQTIFELSSQFSIMVSLFSMINSGSDNLENLLNNNIIWRYYDIFMLNSFNDAFQSSTVLLDELRIKNIKSNKQIFKNLFVYYLVAYFIISLIFFYFIFAVCTLFNDFLNFIAIIPYKILSEDKDISEEIRHLSEITM